MINLRLGRVTRSRAGRIGLLTAAACLALVSPAPAQELAYDATEATWMALDLSPDGRTILFDLLGDIYALDAAGGTARPILRGTAFENGPVFSPDGQWFAFVSDRSGANNLWVARIDGTELRQISKDESAAIWSSPSWSPDGRHIYVSRAIHDVLAFELRMYDVEGGAGVAITNPKPSGTEGFEQRNSALGAVSSPDGRYLYYSRKVGSLWTDHPLPHWTIARRDLRTGTEETIIAAPGAAMRPTLSHDGRTLLYASRRGTETALRVRDLETGEDRWLGLTVDHDAEEGGYYNDLLPRIAFTPDDKAIVTSIGGKIRRFDLATGKLADIAFEAPVKLAIAPQTRVVQRQDDGPVRARVIQAPRQSPDGRTVAFAALGSIYAQALTPGAQPRKLTSGSEGPAFQPSWSPDGRSLVFVTWSALEGGHIWTVAASGGKPRRLTTVPAFYTEPSFSPDGRKIVTLRANHRERLTAARELSPDRPTDIVTMPASGGAMTLVTSAFGARSLQFAGAKDRLSFQAPEGLSSINLDGSDLRRDVLFQMRTWNQYYQSTPIPVEDVRRSPDGTRALVKSASQLYLVGIPPANGGKAPVVHLSNPGVSEVKLTRVGADYFDWADDGRTIIWSVGSTYRRLPLDKVDRTQPPGSSEHKAESFAATVELPRDIPRGTIVLRGATAVTMRGDEVIRGADIVIVDNRIAAIGRTGEVTVPQGAQIRDVTGKFITPGFIDTHAHWNDIRRQILDVGHWDFLANLAYGVTSGLEVQPFTVDIFGYQDMIDAGLMLGPRAYSTGPGVFVNSEINSKADAVAVLTRYRDHYRTRNIKSYMVGARKQRQFMIEGAHELGMMPTTEGASDLTLNLTHAIDGFAGNEHNLPITPLHDDVIRLYAQSRIAYSPTFTVLYGGAASLPELIIRHDPSADAKLRRFMPGGVVEAKMRGREWVPPQDRIYPSYAADAIRLQRAGGLVGMGSHGEVQGLGYHLELEAYASGGATPLEVLRAATIGSAEVIGHASDIGSLEPGKLADLLVMDADPLAAITNTRSLSFVMKNGRLYDAATLDEVAPRAKPLGRQWFQEP
jgi:Tol biopolymer transport system component